MSVTWQVFTEHLLCAKHCAILSYVCTDRCTFTNVADAILLSSKSLRFSRGDNTYTKEDIQKHKRNWFSAILTVQMAMEIHRWRNNFLTEWSILKEEKDFNVRRSRNGIPCWGNSMNKDMEIWNGECLRGWSTSYVELERYWDCFMIITLGISTFCYSDFREPLKILKVWSNREHPVI